MKKSALIQSLVLFFGITRLIPPLHAQVAPPYINYLTTNDLCKFLSVPGLIVPPGKVPAMNDTAVRVYGVCNDSPVDAVLFTSANFTNTPTGGEALSRSAKPYGNEGFVVCRNGGYGSIGLNGSAYLPRQVGQTNMIGSFVPLCR